MSDTPTSKQSTLYLSAEVRKRLREESLVDRAPISEIANRILTSYYADKDHRAARRAAKRSVK